MDLTGLLVVGLLAVPLAGAIIACFVKGERAPRAWALGVSLLTLAVTAGLAARFDFASGAMQMATTLWGLSLPAIGFKLSFALDGVSFWLVALTAALMPLAILASWRNIAQRRTEYFAWMLALEFAMLGVFLARDLLLFYVFFELTLIPMFFIIGIWGGPERRYAAIKFFLFTFSGSLLMFAGIIFLSLNAGPGGSMSFAIEDVLRHAREGISPEARMWVFLAMMAGLAVKVPLFPVHTWLPLAHTEAPTAGSVILAGVLLKLGSYGLFRLAVPIGMPSDLAIRIVAGLCLCGIIYGALVAWVQQDIKKLVAYSSVSHMGFCVLGLFALNEPGVGGSVLYMINHGVSTGALFLVVGMIYDRYHTRDIDQLSGLAKRMPKLAFFFILFTLSSIGLPGTNGFPSEFLTILGAFTSPKLGIFYGVIAALGIILGAIYMLHMAAKVMFGPLKTPLDGGDHGHGHDIPGDINGREVGVLLPLALAVIALGVVPNMVLKSIEGPVKEVISQSRAVAQPAVAAVPALAAAQAQPASEQ
jgi:NADH-quinone oxidoreductase subunit M